jgi:hypothetical protein
LFKEKSLGIKDDTCKLPVGLIDEIITKYNGNRAKNETRIPTVWRHKLSASHFFMRNYPIL